MFKTRLLSGILLVIIALFAVITGGNVLFFVLLAVSLIGMTELYKVFGIEKKLPGVIGYLAAAVYYGLLYFEESLPGEKLNWFMMLFMVFLICQMAALVFAYPRYNTPDHHGIYRLDWGMGSSTHPELCSTRHNPYSGIYIGSNQQQVFSFTTPPVLFLQPRSIKTKEASINCLHGQRV